MPCLYNHDNHNNQRKSAVQTFSISEPGFTGLKDVQDGLSQN